MSPTTNPRTNNRVAIWDATTLMWRHRNTDQKGTTQKDIGKYAGRPSIYSKSENHYNDVIMGPMASQITSLMVVYSTVYSGADHRKHQSSASLAFERGSSLTGEFPAQRASNAENISIWWRHHVCLWRISDEFPEALQPQPFGHSSNVSLCTTKPRTNNTTGTLTTVCVSQTSTGCTQTITQT